MSARDSSSSPPVLQGKKVLVVGLGRSGLAAARLCAGRGAVVTVTDRKSAADLESVLGELPAGVDRQLGAHDPALFVGADLIVLSPGVPDGPEIAAARNAGVPITGELELASRYLRSVMVAITGTNGKSTTTCLCGSMLRGGGRPTFIGGNLGTPLAEAVDTPAGLEGGICVVEVSSFQAETFATFRPQVAVLLNITPDHLDRYARVDDYIAAKARLFAAQTASDFAVMNLDDPLVAEVARGLTSHWVPISTRRVLVEGGWLEENSLCIRVRGGEVERYPADNPRLVGRHNQENALAALLAARLAGALPAEVRRGLLTFKPLHHRMELAAQAGGVRYYDDSKGTNVGATVAAIDGFPRPVILIAGGRDKMASYEPLAEAMHRSGRAAVVIGEAADRIAAALSPVVPVMHAATMEEAVERAASLARPGDAVVLSPACSSFDMFRDYVHRAEVFIAAARNLEREAEDAGSEPVTPALDRVGPKERGGER
jgi:UDP-N-acetylmuramoylalanine--D-glutamate ligase